MTIMDVAIAVAVLAGAGATGTWLHGYFESDSTSWRERSRHAWAVTRCTAAWPFKFSERRQARINDAVDLRMRLLTHSQLVLIARRDKEAFEKALTEAKRLDAFMDAAKPLGQIFAELGRTASAMVDGIAAGIREAGGMPDNLTPRQAQLAADIMRSEQVGEHDQRIHHLSVRTDRIWDDFLPDDCRRCHWIQEPGDDPADQSEAHTEAMEEFGPTVCICPEWVTTGLGATHRNWCPLGVGVTVP